MCKHTNESVPYYYRYAPEGDCIYCIYCIHELFSERTYHPIPLDSLEDDLTIQYFWTYDHKNKIDSVDISFPIFIGYFPGSDIELDIIDGRHRIVKARKLGFNSIDAIVLSPDDLSRCRYR